MFIMSSAFVTLADHLAVPLPVKVMFLLRLPSGSEPASGHSLCLPWWHSLLLKPLGDLALLFHQGQLERQAQISPYGKLVACTDHLTGVLCVCCFEHVLSGGKWENDPGSQEPHEITFLQDQVFASEVNLSFYMSMRPLCSLRQLDKIANGLWFQHALFFHVSWHVHGVKASILSRRRSLFLYFRFSL